MVRITGSGATKVSKKTLHSKYGTKCDICGELWFNHSEDEIGLCHNILREEGFASHRMAGEVMKRKGYSGDQTGKAKIQHRLNHKRKIKRFMDFYMTQSNLNRMKTEDLINERMETFHSLKKEWMSKKVRTWD